jgi:hypothetical protein
VGQFSYSAYWFGTSDQLFSPRYRATFERKPKYETVHRITAFSGAPLLAGVHRGRLSIIESRLSACELCIINGIILAEGTATLNRRIPTLGRSGSVSVYLGGLQDCRRIQLKLRHIRRRELPRFIRSCGVVKGRRREFRVSIAIKPLCAGLRPSQPAREPEWHLAQSAALGVIPPV